MVNHQPLTINRQPLTIYHGQRVNSLSEILNVTAELAAPTIARDSLTGWQTLHRKHKAAGEPWARSVGELVGENQLVCHEIHLSDAGQTQVKE